MPLIKCVRDCVVKIDEVPEGRKGGQGINHWNKNYYGSLAKAIIIPLIHYRANQSSFNTLWGAFGLGQSIYLSTIYYLISALNVIINIMFRRLSLVSCDQSISDSGLCLKILHMVERLCLLSSLVQGPNYYCFWMLDDFNKKCVYTF